jgi:uncharacterized protein YndB with AHSA1/START domain
MTSEQQRIEVSVTINAEPATVWRFLSEEQKLLAWMTFMPGAPVPAGSSFQPIPGGTVNIQFPGGGAAKGKVLELEPPRRLVFTWGYEPDVGKTGLRPGACCVEITLMPVSDGTRVTLVHSGPMSESIAKQHIPGWRHYLSQLALQSTMLQTQSSLADVLIAYFEAWNESDDVKRREILSRCCESDIRVRTQFACTDGIDELSEHIANGLKHMPGCVLAQSGMATHVHGVARVPWSVKSADGKRVFAGENIMTLSSRGRIAHVVGFNS